MNSELQFHRTWPVFGLALFAATWRLWTGQQRFPQVPFFEFLCGVPRSVDVWLFGLAVFSCALLPCVLERRKLLSWTLACFATSLALLIALDQHRAQPWAYQFLIYALLLGLAAPSRRRILIAAVALSIYFYSAIGKLDYQFLHTVGQQIVGQMAAFLGIDATRWPLAPRLWTAALLPLGELAVAALLAWPRSRRVGVAAAVCLHVTLIVVLGPLGLDHQPGVLLWNLFFIAQAFLIFAPRGPFIAQPPALGDGVPGASATTSRRHRLAVLLTLVVLVLPLVERIGLWDHWTSWALYSPHSSRATVEIFAPAVDRLPEPLRTLVDPASQGLPWQRISIDRWSIRSLGVPIYPQARFQLGVALALQKELGAEGAVRVRLRSASTRLSGRRQEEVLRTATDFRRAEQRFLLNIRPRADH